MQWNFTNLRYLVSEAYMLACNKYIYMYMYTHNQGMNPLKNHWFCLYSLNLMDLGGTITETCSRERKHYIK